MNGKLLAFVTLNIVLRAINAVVRTARRTTHSGFAGMQQKYCHHIYMPS